LKLMRIVIAFAIALSAVSAATAQDSTLYCDYITYRGKPYMALEIPMSGPDKFVELARVKHINKATDYEERVRTVQTENDELYAFEVSEGKKKLKLQVFNELIDTSETLERWSSVITSGANEKFVLIGDCYIR
jgi:hypothetical protein